MDTTTNIFMWIFKCSPPEVFLRKDDLKIWNKKKKNKSSGEHLKSDFNKVTKKLY